MTKLERERDAAALARSWAEIMFRRGDIAQVLEVSDELGLLSIRCIDVAGDDVKVYGRPYV
jgi:hypothetical protein